MKLLQRIPERPGSGFRPFADEAIEQSIPRRFEQQVRAFGDRLALRWPEGSYTYASLNATANRLARTLVALRGTPAEPVALLFDHGGEILVESEVGRGTTMTVRLPVIAEGVEEVVAIGEF